MGTIILIFCQINVLEVDLYRPTFEIFSIQSKSLSDGKDVTHQAPEVIPEVKLRRPLSDEPPDSAIVKRHRFIILKNMWVNITAYFILYSAFIGLAVIQSSLVGSIGTMSLALNFGSAIVGCLVIAPPMLRLLGCKVSTLVSFACWACWMASNYYPAWGTVLPAAVISGLAVGPVFAAQGEYITVHCIKLSKLTGEPEDSIIARWFGIVFCLLLLGRYSYCNRMRI